ncbi:MAG: cytochrome c oxidase subunit 3 [Myxococcales bacterium]|nr:cytochrome c oxidase subunit 3 [Myxococcales bacterium]
MPTGRLAVWMVVVSEIVVFGGVLASYIMHRLAHDAWSVQAAHTNMWIGAFNTFVLLTSSLFVAFAHKAAEEGDGVKASNFLWMTVAGGTTFVIVKALEWTSEITAGYTITSSTFWSFYYTAAGLHALHVIAGVVILMIIAMQARKQMELHRVELIGIYWYFVEIVWFFLFPLLYIAK